MNSLYWKSNSHGSQRNMKAEFSRSTLVRIGPIAGRPLTIETWASGSSSLELARDRAGGEIVALADVGGDDQDLARLGLGVGLAGRDHRGVVRRAWPASACSWRHSTYRRTPSENGVAAVQPSSRSARSLETILPPKSPGRAGRVDDLDVADQISWIVSAICLIVTFSSLARL